MRKLMCTAALALPLVLSACVSTAPVPHSTTPGDFQAGSQWQQVPAQIAVVDGGGVLTQSIHAPKQARVGQPTWVDVTSYGGGCVASGSAQVTVEGLLATVQVFDYVDVTPAPDGIERVYNVPLIFMPRRFALVFAERGEATIRVIGARKAPPNCQPTPEVVELRVQVR